MALAVACGAPGAGDRPGTGAGTGGAGASGGAGGTTGGTGAGGSSAGSGQLEVDCAAPAVGSPALRLLTRNEIVNTLNDVFPSLAGQWSHSLPSGTLSEFDFDNSVTNTVGIQMAEGILETAESVALAVTGPDLATLLPCSQSAPDRACAEQFVSQYGRRLFRRPLAQAELDDYLGFFDNALSLGADFPTALKWVTVGLIQSPRTVYRSEIGSDNGDGVRALSAHELATELAYTFTSSTPSEELLTAADGGTLGDPVSIAGQLLATPRGQETLQHFFSGYLNYTGVAAIQRAGVSGFDAVNNEMVLETRAFVAETVFANGGGLRELLTAGSTNPSVALAAFYGLPTPASDYASVPRPAGQGIGILSQGAFLASHANADGSSPTQRGLFTFLRLLCQPKPEPPPGVPQISEPEPGVKTTRQRYEEVHGQVGTPCAGCHRSFDPIGFAFEHFDEAGRYRETEVGLPIDASGSITDPSGNVLFSFDSEEQLMQELVNQPIIYECFNAHLAAFAFGNGEACLAPSSAEALQTGELGIASAYAAIASAPNFSTRRLQ